MYDAYAQVFDALRAHVPCGRRRSRARSAATRARSSWRSPRSARTTFVWCEHCDYAANIEAAATPAVRRPSRRRADAAGDARRCTRPTCPGSTASPSTSSTTPTALLKAIAFDVDGELGLALVPGDREVNEFALAAALAPARGAALHRRRLRRAPRAAEGLHRPGLRRREARRRRLVDRVRRTAGSPARTRSTTTSRDMVLGRDFTPTDVGRDRRSSSPATRARAAGSRCASTAASRSATSSSSATSTRRRSARVYTDEDGEQHPMVMGCYGIGVSRDRRRDRRGAPRRARARVARGASRRIEVHIVVLPGRGDTAATVIATATELYDGLRARGVDVLLDDRDASPGIKFADADLLGMPVQVTVGAKGVGRGRGRAQGARHRRARRARHRRRARRPRRPDTGSSRFRHTSRGGPSLTSRRPTATGGGPMHVPEVLHARSPVPFFMVWNTVLALVPLGLALVLFRRGVTHGDVSWWAGVVAVRRDAARTRRTCSPTSCTWSNGARHGVTITTAPARTAAFVSVGMLAYTASIARLQRAPAPHRRAARDRGPRRGSACTRSWPSGCSSAATAGGTRGTSVCARSTCSPTRSGTRTSAAPSAVVLLAAGIAVHLAALLRLGRLTGPPTCVPSDRVTLPVPPPVSPMLAKLSRELPEGRRLELRAEVGRLPLHRVPRR